MKRTHDAPGSRSALDRLGALLDPDGRVVVLTGAGCSTDSGIPDYRCSNGRWKRRQPIQFSQFVKDEGARRRYWARSYAGWPQFSSARPNMAHVALAALEAGGRIHHLITQNVDGLHQAAGQQRVIDLHGRLSRVVCLDCAHTMPRQAYQTALARSNPEWRVAPAPAAPDGDADLDHVDDDSFEVVPCPSCGGMVKPDVVFFGEQVPAERVGAAMERVEEAGALLVVGSSLMVWSGYRFARAAHKRGIPISIVNIGTTRADDLASIRIRASCREVLSAVAEMLDIRMPAPFGGGGRGV